LEGIREERDKGGALAAAAAVVTARQAMRSRAYSFLFPVDAVREGMMDESRELSGERCVIAREAGGVEKEKYRCTSYLPEIP
jgi:hypothetical protein